MNLYKKFLFSIILFALSFMLFNINAAADDKEYTVDSAEFDVYFDTENGDAYITEKWDVNYTKGEFTRFYKDINNPLNQVEYNNNISIIDAYINGQKCTETNSIDRVDYHYYFEEGNNGIAGTVHWFLHASMETVHYEITYKLSHCVKLDKNNNAVFCYRFIGENFPVIVKNVQVNIYVDDEYIYSVDPSSGSYKINDNSLLTEDILVHGMYKIKLKMDNKLFNNLIRIIDNNVPKEKKSFFKLNKDNFLYILFYGFGLILILAKLSPKLFDLIYSNRLLKNNPNIFSESASRMDFLNIPFPAYMCAPKKRICNKGGADIILDQI